MIIIFVLSSFNHFVISASYDFLLLDHQVGCCKSQRYGGKVAVISSDQGECLLPFPADTQSKDITII